MSVDVSRKINEFISDIATENGLDSPHDIHYETEREVGKGYSSKTLAADIEDKGRSLHLFIKYIPEIRAVHNEGGFHNIFSNEIHFYTNIYPAYKKFLNDHGVVEGFRNVPTWYGNRGNAIIAMENLKYCDFVPFDKTQDMNGEHISLAFKTFAKFHAISYAMKDQRRELYEELTGNLFDFYNVRNMLEIQFDEMIGASVRRFLSKLDSEKDKSLLEKGENLAESLFNCLVTLPENFDKSVVVHGDCWRNNMLFSYKDVSKSSPSDVMLVDFQLIRLASPVFDLSYFFYSVATGELLDKLDEYLDLYYEELSKRIDELGSDPNALYPYASWKEDWKKYCKGGVAMAFMAVRTIVFSKGEVRIDYTDQTKPRVYSRESEYIQRMKDIMTHLIGKDLL